MRANWARKWKKMLMEPFSTHIACSRGVSETKTELCRTHEGWPDFALWIYKHFTGCLIYNARCVVHLPFSSLFPFKEKKKKRLLSIFCRPWSPCGCMPQDSVKYPDAITPVESIHLPITVQVSQSNNVIFLSMGLIAKFPTTCFPKHNAVC